MIGITITSTLILLLLVSVKLSLLPSSAIAIATRDITPINRKYKLGKHRNSYGRKFPFAWCRSHSPTP